MKVKPFVSTLILATSLTTVSAFAAINRPVGHAQGSTYEECGVECNEFADSKACTQFRQTNLICTEKKKSTWPILTAQVLKEMEC
jgi:hypothetical protein